jgi:hypothetical protein
MKEKNVQNEITEADETIINFNAGPKITDSNITEEVKNEEENLISYYKSTIFGKLFFNWSRYSIFDLSR